ncbi:MAG: tetratricopeptide repeat protein [Elusimicrobiota bacterium]
MRTFILAAILAVAVLRRPPFVAFAQVPVTGFSPSTSVAAPAPTGNDNAAASPAALLSAVSPTAALLPAPARISSGDSGTARWIFIDAASKNGDYSGARSEMINDLETFLSRDPDSNDAPRARLLESELEQENGDYAQALVELLHIIREFPDSSVALEAQSTFQKLGKKRLPERFGSALITAAQAPASPDKAGRLSGMIDELAQNFGPELYAPAIREIRSFMSRFPDDPGMDKIQWDLAVLNQDEEKYSAALFDMQELLALYPRSTLVPRARYRLGGLYAELGFYEKAVGVYQKFVADYSSSPKAIPALFAIADIFTNHLKQYDMAAKTDEMIIARVPPGRAAAQALYQESRLYDCHFLFFACELDNPDQALSIYNRISDTGNMDFLDKKDAELVRSRINSLTKSLAKSKAPSAPAPTQAQPSPGGQ